MNAAAPSDQPDSRPSDGVLLREVLPFLLELARTGRLTGGRPGETPLEVWIEAGQVVDAAWGTLRGLSALEMSGVFLPRANFVFSDGARCAVPSLRMGADELVGTLDEAARESAALGRVVPGLDAAPVRVRHAGAGTQQEGGLEGLDGRRSVRDLVEKGRALEVLRGLADLAEQGEIVFRPSTVAPIEQPPPSSSRQGVGTPRTAIQPPRAAPGRRAVSRVALLIVIAGVALVVSAAIVMSVFHAERPTGTLAVLDQPTALLSPTVAATEVPTSAPAAVVVAALPSPSVAVSLQPSPSPVARQLLDETFTTGARNWPNHVGSTVWADSLGYHLTPRVAGQHVAVTAPLGEDVSNVVVSGTFSKREGPPGGGYGLILRQQGATLDGVRQDGQFYVFEVGDRGEVGIWRRDNDHWVDLLPWTTSATVRPGVASNRLEVRAAGTLFTFLVNDTTVAQVSDLALAKGAVGLFAGGDGNHALVQRFTVAQI